MLNKGFITAMAFHDPQGLQKLLPGGEIAENYKSDMEEEIAKYKEGVKKGTIKIG